MTQNLNILICDDDPQFAAATVASLYTHLLPEIPSHLLHIQPISNLSQVRQIAANPTEARRWQAIFCDLGWGDLTLAGIQILHDIQLSNPHIFTLLYTAQDANAVVSQTMEWKLQFIDRVLKVDPVRFYPQLREAVAELCNDQHVHSAINVSFSATHLIPAEDREMLIPKLGEELQRLHDHVRDAWKSLGHGEIAGEILITPEDLQFKFKPSPGLQQQKSYDELLAAIRRFPQLEPHDLVPLSKAAYITFVQEKYGGFPQMAEERGLDLNHIYRVGRRFKNAPFVAFKLGTINEIVGIYEEKERLDQIRRLLCSPRLIRKARDRNN